MILIFYATIFAATTMVQDDAPNIVRLCDLQGAMSSGRYKLAMSYSGKVANSHDPEVFSHLPPEARNKLSKWQLTLTNAKVTLDEASKILFQSDKGAISAKSKAVLLDVLPTDEEIKQLKTVDEFRKRFGKPQKGFRDGSVRIDSDGKSITSSTEQWVVCSVEKEATIQYLRVVLWTKEQAGQVSIVDRWIQRAELQARQRNGGQRNGDRSN